MLTNQKQLDKVLSLIKFMLTNQKQLDKVLSLIQLVLIMIIILSPVFPGASDFSQKYHLNDVVIVISRIKSDIGVDEKHKAAKKKKS